MKEIFDHLSAVTSKKTTTTYSTSFSLGIYFLNESLRTHIYSIYGFVRFADEIVDSFSGFNQRVLLSKFKRETYEALEEGISLNPIINSFQHTYRKFSIKKEWVDLFFNSMEMDLDKRDYTKEDYTTYIFGSAEVVGLMCLHVFTNGNLTLFEKLKPYAMKLGSAFQKVNFLRDMKSDFHKLGRVYFPKVDFNLFDEAAKKEIENEIEEEFRYALNGIKQLPRTSRAGVYLAYVYYHSLFKKIKRMNSGKIKTTRIRINNPQKIGLMINSLVKSKMRLV